MNIARVIFVSLTFLFQGHALYAFVASSTNYAIERDSINFAGRLSTSSSYGIEDTLGEAGSGRILSTNYQLEAGYQQTDYSISITSANDITLLPAIVSLGGGLATSAATWTVTTNNPLGYSLAVNAGTVPALKSANSSFSNYTSSGSGPDFLWSVSANSSEFGFSPEGLDIVSTYRDNGSACSLGSLDTVTSCWDSITASSKIVSRSTSANSPNGASTTLRFQAEAGANASQASGAYSAVITVTAIAL